MAGVAAVVLVWWVLADTLFLHVGVSPKGGGGSVPDPAGVVASIVSDGFGFYWPNLVVTLTEAAIGYVLGNVVALALAALVMVVPRPGEPAGTAEFLAAMLVFFTTVVGSLLGLGAADRSALEIVSVNGGGKMQQLFRVRLIAAVPSVLTALKIAAPSAFLGAILGEYLGGVDVGLGPALINAQQTLQIPRTWGLALVAGLVSLAAYLLVGLIGRLVAPWSTSSAGVQVVGTATAGPSRRGGAGAAVASSVGRALLGLVAVLVLWVGFLWAFQIPAFVGKGPLDVVAYFFTGPDAAAVRRSALGLLAVSLADSALGFAVGLALALVVAASFVLVRSVEQALLPIALLLQSVPLIAVAPILVLILGRSTATIAAMGAIVVLFPALVNITFGLRSAPQQALDLIAVNGGGRVAALLRVALPYSLPSVFAAIRISVPGAVTGALIVEWLATGQGIGNAIVAAVGDAQLDAVWGLAALISLVTLVIYQLVAVVESFVVARLGFRS